MVFSMPRGSVPWPKKSCACQISFSGPVSHCTTPCPVSKTAQRNMSFVLNDDASQYPVLYPSQVHECPMRHLIFIFIVYSPWVMPPVHTHPNPSHHHPHPFSLIFLELINLTALRLAARGTVPRRWTGASLVHDGLGGAGGRAHGASVTARDGTTALVGGG